MACTAQSNFECASINEKLPLILSFANDLSWFSEEKIKHFMNCRYCHIEREGIKKKKKDRTARMEQKSATCQAIRCCFTTVHVVFKRSKQILRLFQNDLRHRQWFSFLSPATVSSLIGHFFSILEKMLDYCICHFGPLSLIWYSCKREIEIRRSVDNSLCIRPMRYM